MDQVPYEAKGVNGQIELLGDRIRIKRKGAMSLLTHGFKGDKGILLLQISSIQFREAGAFTNGYIQFAFVGGRDATGALFQATHDENTVMFTSQQEEAFGDLKRRIEGRMLELRQPVPQISVADEIEKLAQLRQKGILTEEEFTIKKRQLLGR